MLKKSFFYFIILSLFAVACNPSDKKEGKYDTRAIESLDQMSETIGDLSSCSYTLNTDLNRLNNSNELENIINEHDVYMRGPDKLYVYSTGSKGKRSYWYNGNRFSYYSYGRNVYDTLSVSGNILDAIDLLHNKYGIDFPAGDFFYPSLTDDLIENSNEILFLEKESLDGNDYTIIEAINKDKTIIIWIDENTKLPYQLIMTSNDESGISYHAVFSNWRVNPKLSDIMFEFEPTGNYTREKLQTKK